jgi:hypothetical protein
MATGIIIHVEVGKEKRTELFSEERIRIGASNTSDLQIRTNKVGVEGIWLELNQTDGIYRIARFNQNLKFLINDEPIQRYQSVDDGDIISLAETDIVFSFFALTSKSSLITTNREQTHVAQFIEEAALESSTSPKRDEAKAFLREFIRELSREISWTTKMIVLAITLGALSGIFYLGYSFYRELRQNREQAQAQNETIKKLQEQLTQNNEQLSNLDKTNKDIIKTVSLAPNLRVEYGSGVCLIAGVYDLVDRRNGKTLRYPDPAAYQPDPYEPAPTVSEEGFQPKNPPSTGLTTEGNGTPVEYDFIGTGFHVGSGFIVTNRHVLQPWEEDDLVKQMMKQANGRARIKRLVVYFPNFPQSFPLKIQQVGGREDLGIATVDPNLISPEIPVLPLDGSNDSVAIGKTVVTMGYPNGPDRLLAMLDDDEAKSINSKFGTSRQNLLNFLAQSKKITPLTTPGAITDLDARRIVHDAKTAEGGSGAPLFGQSGKVIGVNFGVFTESNAANMAIPIRYAIDLLKRAGWKSPEELEAAKDQPPQTASANTNTATEAKPQ